VSSQGAAESDCQVAFMSTKDGNWEIYVANVLRGTVTRLTTSSGNDGLPTWSPDGDQIAFVSDRGGSWGVYAMPATGGEAVEIANWGEAHTNWLVERIAWVR
jgi:TolB protein